MILHKRLTGRWRLAFQQQPQVAFWRPWALSIQFLSYRDFWKKRTTSRGMPNVPFDFGPTGISVFFGRMDSAPWLQSKNVLTCNKCCHVRDLTNVRLSSRIFVCRSIECFSHSCIAKFCELNSWRLLNFPPVVYQYHISLTFASSKPG